MTSLRDKLIVLAGVVTLRLELAGKMEIPAHGKYYILKKYFIPNQHKKSKPWKFSQAGISRNPKFWEYQTRIFLSSWLHTQGSSYLFPFFEESLPAQLLVSQRARVINLSPQFWDQRAQELSLSGPGAGKAESWEPQWNSFTGKTEGAPHQNIL